MKLNSIYFIFIGILIGGAIGYGGATWFYAPQYGELQTEYLTLETQYETLSQEYSTLAFEHVHHTNYSDALFDNFTIVTENYQTLFTNYNILAEDYIILEIEKTNAFALYETLSRAYGDLEAEYSELQQRARVVLPMMIQGIPLPSMT